jgi:4'-phosphopantetheinyl transferase
MDDSTPLRWLALGEQHVPPGREWLSPLEADRAAGMRFAKRRNDFLVSRWTAKQALAYALHPAAADPHRVEVRPAPTGAPVAFVAGDPAPCSISLTDRAGWAVCLIGPPDRLVGCDLELVEERTPAFVADWFTPAERAVVAAHETDHDLLANLIWSAKESALKVLQTGLRRDTRTVEVTLHDEQVGEWRALTVEAVEGAVFPGWWCRHGDFLLTVAADAPLAPPASLLSPEPLRDAVPTHSWMDELS